MPIPLRGDGAADEVTVNDPAGARAPLHSDSKVSTSNGHSAPFEGGGGHLGLLLVGHGSRRPDGNSEFAALVETFARRHPGPRIAHCHVELALPSLAEALDQLAREVDEVVLVPVFLFLAGHVKNDLPLAVERARGAHPGVAFRIARPLGVDPRMADLAGRRLVGALAESRSDPKIGEGTACLLVGRGSSDPDANGDFYKVARLLAEFQAGMRVEPCFLGVTGPDVATGLDILARQRPRRIVVVPYLLFAGRLIERLEAIVRTFRSRNTWLSPIVAGHLDADPIVLDLLAERARGALAGSAPLPCDTCQYRSPLPGRAEQAGGLRALLWSMRHTYTHTQAMPAEHAHPAVEKHVFVCTNVDCAKRGATGVLRRLRSDIKAAGISRRIRVTRTACMGRCGEGPSVAVYPDGIWYRDVTEKDVPELVTEHLQGDRLVARLVDNILQ